jgi:phosphopantothenoylcysteine decarboxylase
MVTSSSTAAAKGPSPAAAVAEAMHDGRVHLLLASSGSVATIKLPLIISALQHHPKLSIRVILTKSAAHFLAGQSAEQPTLASIAALPNVDAIHQDEDEWVEPWTRGAAILHINLRKWADILVVAPLSANTLAKVVNGLSDNLLTSVIRAWDTTGLADGKGSRIVVAPAMNVAMMMHPVTARQIRVLEEEWGVREDEDSQTGRQGWFEVLTPIQKTLACGDVGTGAMIEWTEVVKVIEKRLGLPAQEPAISA